MSFKKIKLIKPETVRNPENDYIYLGYGDASATFPGFTGLWIKESDGTIIPISGGSASGGGSSYWIKSGTDLYYNAEKVFINTDNSATSTAQALTINGGIKISDTTTNTDGSIRFHSGDFQGYKNSTDGWVTLTYTGTTGGGTSGTTYWIPTPSGDYGIILDNDPKKAYIGENFTASADDDTLNIDGGINLTETSKTNAGTIHYSTSGYFEGYTNSNWSKLNVFDVDASGAFYNGKVLIDSGTQPAEQDYSLYISGDTYGESYISLFDYTDHGGGDGGFAGYSGGTIQWGITATYEFGNNYEVDIVNGLIVNVTYKGP